MNNNNHEYKEICFYARFALDEDSEKEKWDNIARFLASNSNMSTWLFVDNNCLGRTPPLERKHYCSMLNKIIQENIKTVVVPDLCDISTDPQELVIRLYDLTMRGVDVIVLSEKRTITVYDIDSFNFGYNLKQIEKLIAHNADNRFTLIADHSDRKVWYDTLEDVFYCKRYYADGSVGFYPADYSFYYEKDIWDSQDIEEDALSQLYQVVYESHFVEEIVYDGTAYYMWFEINFHALLPHCCVYLDNYWIEQSNNIIASNVSNINTEQ